MLQVKNQSPQKQPNTYLKYTNMAIQMAAIIGIGSWGGYKLDAYFANKTPVFTIVLSLVAIFAAMYITLKDFIKPGK